MLPGPEQTELNRIAIQAGKSDGFRSSLYHSVELFLNFFPKARPFPKECSLANGCIKLILNPGSHIML